jgi:hypothetical protein
MAPFYLVESAVWATRTAHYASHIEALALLWTARVLHGGISRLMAARLSMLADASHRGFFPSAVLTRWPVRTRACVLIDLLRCDPHFSWGANDHEFQLLAVDHHATAPQ